MQAGKIRNQGIELALVIMTHSVRLNFSTNFTYTLNQNEVVRLANGEINTDTGEAIEMEYYSNGVLGASGGPVLRMQKAEAWEIFIPISVCASLLMDIFG